eukprot:482081-Pyramimonas_sp.AAC.2
MKQLFFILRTMLIAMMGEHRQEGRDRFPTPFRKYRPQIPDRTARDVPCASCRIRSESQGPCGRIRGL